MTVMGKLLGVSVFVSLAGRDGLAGPRPRSRRKALAASINPGRDCQTITTCQFKKGGSYRGCLSSYSCRVCNYVAAPCKMPAPRGRVCRTSVCTWGG